MLLNPSRGQKVRVHYRPQVAPYMPLHGKIGSVVVPGSGRPRNHCVEIDGRLYLVPAGNLVIERPGHAKNGPSLLPK
jgi:hypothetical protein